MRSRREFLVGARVDSEAHAASRHACPRDGARRGAEGKWQVSRSGGGAARWSRAGDKIFYQTSDRTFEVAIDRTPTPAPGEPVLLVSGPAIGARISPFGFERSIDGTRLLFPRSPLSTSEIGAVRLIEQWAKQHKGK